jgi:thiol-disulfide isomerase/thioredoxin
MASLKKIFVFTLIFLLSKCCLSQQSFSACYDSLTWHLKYDTTTGFSDKYINWAKCVKGKEFPLLSLQTISGKKIEMENLKGKIVVINLWFSGCHPCIEEMPALNRLVSEYKNQNVVFFGITFDSKEILERDFFPKYKFDFEIIPYSTNTIKTIGNTGFPTTYFIDNTGIVKNVWAIGSDENVTDVYLNGKQIIDGLLKAK